MSQTDSLPVLGITCGDPAGIGLEVVLRAIGESQFQDQARVVLYVADAHLQAQRCWSDALYPDLISSLEQSLFEPEAPRDVGGLSWRRLPGPVSSPVLGRYDPQWGAVARNALELSAADALSGVLNGVVTAPITKRILAQGGPVFPGQTELFGSVCGVERYVMMLAGPRLRVALVTGHIPLKDVAGRLSISRIRETIVQTHRSLIEDFGIQSPRIAVCGLNPHAGEQGAMGDEELVVISPAIESAQRLGVDASGPHPPDSIFHFAVNGSVDAVVCMYHDQGLIPLKLMHFDDGVNVTLGLPIVRTSPDHGTAYDIASDRKANPTSMAAAIQMALSMVRARKRMC